MEHNQTFHDVDAGSENYPAIALPAFVPPVELSLGFSASDEVFGTEDSENQFLKSLDEAWNDPEALEALRCTLRRDISDFAYINVSDTHEMRVALKMAATRIQALSH